MLSAADIVLAAKQHKSKLTVSEGLRWVGMGDFGGVWVVKDYGNISITDAMILEYGRNVKPNYKEAVLSLTGWSDLMLYGFKEAILARTYIQALSIGNDVAYWRGAELGLEVLAELKEGRDDLKI